MGGIAVNVLGHAHPKIVAALKDQADKVWHVLEHFRDPRPEALGEKLVRNTFADAVFLAIPAPRRWKGRSRRRRYHL